MLWAFIPIAVLLTISPGPATAMVVRSAVRGGRRDALATIVGNEIGVVVWALLSVVGVSALVAASEVAFVVLKVTGAAVLIWIGVQTLRHAGGSAPPPLVRGHAFRDGLVTAIANPKLAVFFVALFPQFVDPGASVLVAALVMATLLVVLDFGWYMGLALVVGRAKRSYEQSRLAAWIERTTGAVLIALGARIAVEQR